MVEMYIDGKESIAYPGGRRKNATEGGRAFISTGKGWKKRMGWPVRFFVVGFVEMVS